MSTVWMMKMVAAPVIDVAAMRHGLVTTARTVNVIGLVPAAAMIGRAPLRVLARYRDHVFVDVIVVRVVQMALVYVIDMAVVMDGGMTAAGTVAVIMARMDRPGTGIH
jgi:hypothetical protein